ncbi:MAG: hypothetical protein GKS04_00805 [Candidatus Mycalebacterium zealandia]|nr:MAG: hypothetical protein GKS04_00805 [Candidatus Mycalebacterium zealandia]
MAESKKITRSPEIDSETAMALSIVDAGCIAFSGLNGVVFAVKDLALAFLFENDFEPSVNFQFEFVDKEEFPAVCAFVFIETGGGKFSYEYFFSLESEKDMENLALLEHERRAEIWFTDRDGNVSAGVSAGFDSNETARIESACKSVVSRA